MQYVILRCGYRGSASGVLVEDQKFKRNIQGATAAGLKVGIYFFSQAVNEVEAVEEASMTLSLIKNYRIAYPVYIDVESANGRADGISKAARTSVINAFCQTIRNSGYTPGTVCEQKLADGKNQYRRPWRLPRSGWRSMLLHRPMEDVTRCGSIRREGRLQESKEMLT